MRKAAFAVALAVLVGTVVVAAAVANTSGSAAASQLARCTNVSLGVNAPLTGPAGFLGQEQLSWAAVRRRRSTTRRTGRGSRSSRATRSSTPRGRARRLSGSSRTRTSWPWSDRRSARASITSARLITKAKLAAISPSATRTSLTIPKRISVMFFRNVPNDTKQAPQVANYFVTQAEGRQRRRRRLAGRLLGAARELDRRALLKRKGVKVNRESVAATDTDFSSIVTNIGSERRRRRVRDADGVAGPDDVPAAARAGQEGGRVRHGRLPTRRRSTSHARATSPSFAAGPALRAVRARDRRRRTTRSRRTRRSAPSGRRATWRAWIAMDAPSREHAQTAASAAAKYGRSSASRTSRRSSAEASGSTAKGDMVGGKFAIYKVTNGKYAKAS